jgi:hypothetical protein
MEGRPLISMQVPFLKSLPPILAWSVDVQTELIKSKLINIVSESQKRRCQKVASMHFATLHGRLTNGYNI